MLKDRLGVYGLGLLLIVAGFAIAYVFVEPAPPRALTLATASPDGAYHAYGERYRRALARQGITLTLVPTAGSIDNLRRLSDPEGPVDVAFVQGGTGMAVDGDGLESLASLYFEPFWVFTTLERTVGRLADLRGWRVVVGAEGSGSRALALRLLAEDGVGPDDVDLLPLGGAEAHAALGDGTADALIVVAAAESKTVGALLADPALRPNTLDRVDALTRRNRFLSAVRLPRGVVDPAADIPAEDVTVVAPAATLVAKDSLHPALVTLLLQVATDVHREGTVLTAPGMFPTARFVEFPLSDEARRFFDSGPSWLQEYLPFWAADLIDRLKILLLPLLTLALPLARVLPPTLRWRIRSRIYRWYRDLLEIETQALTAPDAAARRALHERLDVIDHEVQNLSVPLSYADNAYTLRMHIGLVRERLNAAGSVPPSETP